MEKIIGITNVRTKIKDIVDKVSDKEETYIVTRDSKSEAVIISYDKYLENKELIYLFTLDAELASKLTEIAKSRQVSSESLINAWLREKIWQ